MSRITSSGKRSQTTAWPASLAKLSKSRSDPASVDNTSSDAPEGMPLKARFAINNGMGQRSPRASTDAIGTDESCMLPIRIFEIRQYIVSCLR